MTYNHALCLLATAALPTPQAVERIPVCVDLAQRAVDRSLDPALIVSVAVEESQLNPAARSHRGARGILQVLPQWHCPGASAIDCDFAEAGLLAVEKWRERFGDEWPCHFNAGNECGGRALRYARRVRRRAESWRARMDAGK